MASHAYREYLRSDHWRSTRRDALERAAHACQLCASKYRLDVHHRTYDRLGAERPEDLTVLCRMCHEKHHDQLPKYVAVAMPERVSARRQVELRLLEVMASGEEWVERAAEVVGADDFDHDDTREAFVALIQGDGKAIAESVVLAELHEAGAGVRKATEMFAMSINRLHLSALERQAKQVREVAVHGNDEAKQMAALVELAALATKRRALERAYVAHVAAINNQSA